MSLPVKYETIYLVLEQSEIMCVGFSIYVLLLYKHQWNTKWALAWKLGIFTCENNMLSSHVKISPLLWLHNKPHLSDRKMLWYFIGVYIINRTLHGHLEIPNFSSCVKKKYFTCLLRSLVTYFSTLEGKFRISVWPCNILYLCCGSILSVSFIF